MSILHRFPGGVHPHEGKGGKEVTSIMPITEAPLPSRVMIPLQQHIGAPCKPLVQKGDTVKVGQMIGEPVGYVSTAVHASVSGKVVDCMPCIMANGLQQNCVVIDNDFEENWVELEPTQNPEALTPAQLAEIARNMGVVGMGGATFPTSVKLSVPADKHVDTLVINGVECEPYLSADHQLMLAYANEIIGGIMLVKNTLGIEKVLIGIELNKPNAIETMKKACEGYEGVSVFGLEVKYPQGGEKQLLYALTGRKVPVGKLPMDVGAIVMNVGTCYALYRAVYEGRPVIDRVVTVGGAVKQPANYMTRIGVPVEWLLDTSGGLLPETRMLIYGGPMMGQAISRQDIPVTKGCSGLTALDKVLSLAEETPCIRCGRCREACPMQLSPAAVDRYVRKGMLNEAEGAGAMNCIECGACSWSCPAKRSLTQSCRTAKKLITQKHKEEAAKKEVQ